MTGLSVGGVGKVGSIVEVSTGMGDGSGYGTGGFHRLVGSGAGINDDIELADEVDTEEELAVGSGIYVGVWLSVESGVWLGGVVGIVEGISVFSGVGIKVEQMVGGPVGAGVGTDDGIGFGEGYGIAEKFTGGTVVLGSLL